MLCLGRMFCLKLVRFRCPYITKNLLAKSGKLFVRLGYRFQYVFADVWSTASHEREWPCWRRQRGIYVHGYILHIHVSVTFFSCPFSLSFWCQMQVLRLHVRSYGGNPFHILLCTYAFLLLAEQYLMSCVYTVLSDKQHSCVCLSHLGYGPFKLWCW